VKLAAVQYRPPKGDPELARSELVDWLGQAGSMGADLVVCPEMATTGYVWPNAKSLRAHAEPAAGPTYQALAPMARKWGTWIVVGFVEQVGSDLYNSALVIDGEGELAGVYRKVLLYDLDKAWAVPGLERWVRETPLGRLACGICMDLNDPGFITHLMRDEVDVLAFCTNWLEQGIDVLEYWNWQLGPYSGWFVAANSWGPDGDISFCGRSVILDPQGRPRAMAEQEGNQVLCVDTGAPCPAPRSRLDNPG